MGGALSDTHFLVSYPGTNMNKKEQEIFCTGHCHYSKVHTVFNYFPQTYILKGGVFRRGQEQGHVVHLRTSFGKSDQRQTCYIHARTG